MTATPDMMSKAMVVLSGGQDSTTCLYWAKQKFESVRAITFSYGQRHAIELESARQIAKLVGIEHDLIELGSVFARLSSLTDEDQKIPVAKNDDASSNNARQESATTAAELPSTFVPGRNILFLSLAASRAYVHNCDTIVIGVSQEDFAGYPDCRESFISSMETAICKGLDRQIRIAAPLMHLSKKETVELALSMPGCQEALSLSTTCYNGAVPPCQECNACLLRARGFAQAGIADPLVVRTSLSGNSPYAR
jgi:7-cyano-7-deazaguanine synthase